MPETELEYKTTKSVSGQLRFLINFKSLARIQIETVLLNQINGIARHITTLLDLAVTYCNKWA